MKKPTEEQIREVRKEIEQLEEEDEEITEKIAELYEEIDTYELNDPTEDDTDATNEFLDFIDGLYGSISISGVTFNASHILRELDPVACREAFSEWADDIIRVKEDEKKELVAELADIEEKLEDLRGLLEEQ